MVKITKTKNSKSSKKNPVVEDIEEEIIEAVPFSEEIAEAVPEESKSFEEQVAPTFFWADAKGRQIARKIMKTKTPKKVKDEDAVELHDLNTTIVRVSKNTSGDHIAVDLTDAAQTYLKQSKESKHKGRVASVSQLARSKKGAVKL